MGSLYGILSFENGFVIVSDIIKNAEEESSFIVKINEYNVVVLANDKEYGKKFCEQYLKTSISEKDGHDKIVTTATNAFTNLSKEYEGKLLSMHFIGYDSPIKQKPFHSILFDGKKIIYNSSQSSFNKTMFAFEVNLGTFIVNKVYSNYMSVQEAINLMGYVGIQYRILYPDSIGKNISIATLSESGFKILPKDEIKEILENAEKMDMRIRKDCTDFFLTNNIGVQK